MLNSSPSAGGSVVARAASAGASGVKPVRAVVSGPAPDMQLLVRPSGGGARLALFEPPARPTLLDIQATALGPSGASRPGGRSRDSEGAAGDAAGVGRVGLASTSTASFYSDGGSSSNGGSPSSGVRPGGALRMQLAGGGGDGGSGRGGNGGGGDNGQGGVGPSTSFDARTLLVWALVYGGLAGLAYLGNNILSSKRKLAQARTCCSSPTQATK